MNQQVSIANQTLMWFSGLRGAVSFALAVSFLEHPDFSPAIKGAIFGTTVLVILFTVLGLGGLTPYLLKWLQIVPPQDSGDHHAIPSDTHGSHPPAEEMTEDVEEIITEADLTQPVFGWLYRLDVK